MASCTSSPSTPPAASSPRPRSSCTSSPARTPSRSTPAYPTRTSDFVAEGQSAAVKVETFPFTRYGTLQAEIVDVADDAVPDDKTGLYYPLRARLLRTVMEIDGRPVRLTAGMAVTLEVRTGTRRIIEFALSPLLQGLNESGRER
ncbi:MAG: HlyD family secretion protein [Comamonadaceae bacterium]|nr:HlyD family secretion protein [Comamonadaceae bacterium]